MELENIEELIVATHLETVLVGLCTNAPLVSRVLMEACLYPDCSDIPKVLPEKN